MLHDVDKAFRLDEKVAVVTGAASGIGRAVAEVYASAGARVVLGDVATEAAEEAAAGIREAGGEARALRTDVSRRAEVFALVDEAVGAYGGLDVMVNVAGIPGDGPIAELAEDEFDRVVGVNLKGHLFGCQAAVAAMRERGGGSIVNVASAAIDLAVPRYGLYALTKAALTQLTQTLATEVGELGIRVNVLAPGATVTAFTQRHLEGPDGLVNQEHYDTFMDSMRAMSPLGLVGEPVDQAWLALYLASDASRYCTGQIWRANGGQVIVR